MSKQVTPVPRRRFLQTAVASVGAAAVAPMFIPSSALGRGGFVAPSERVIVGGIGIGRRGGYDLGCFLQQPDVQFVGVADIKQKRRAEVKQIVDKHYGNKKCETYRDFREVLDRREIDARVACIAGLAEVLERHPRADHAEDDGQSDGESNLAGSLRQRIGRDLE